MSPRFWLLAGLVALVSCGREEKPRRVVQPERPPDPLEEASPGIAGIRDRLGMHKLLECGIASTSRTADSEWAKQWAAEAAADCDFVTRVEAAVEPTLEKIAATGTVPSDLFFTEVFIEHVSEDEDELYEPLTIGVFESMAACEKLESRLRAENRPTRRCAKWDPKAGESAFSRMVQESIDRKPTDAEKK
jgi:hypothetical protein